MRIADSAFVGIGQTRERHVGISCIDEYMYVNLDFLTPQYPAPP